MILREGTPIIDGEGKVVAYMNQTLEFKHGDEYHWTWFSPRASAELHHGPKFADAAKMVPANHGRLRAAYQRGDFMVLSCVLEGDTESAFNGDLFRLPDEPVSHTWAGKLAALDVLEEHLRDAMMGTQVDYLREMFTHYAEHETRKTA